MAITETTVHLDSCDKVLPAKGARRRGFLRECVARAQRIAEFPRRIREIFRSERVLREIPTF
jgi:hypothetical protein